MTVAYRTVVVHLPPTPMGLLPDRWIVEHWCRACRQQVPNDQLVAHARDRHSTDIDGSVTPAADPGTMTPDVIEPRSAEEVIRG